MYINDIHILYYVLFGFLGMVAGVFTDWCIKRLGDYKKVISKDFFKIYLKSFSPKYILMFINFVVFILILYTFGITDLRTYTYILLTPMLISVIMIDIKKQIIPNRLTLTIFELGLIFAFLQGISNLNSAINSIFRNDCRSWNFPFYNFSWKTNFRKRSFRIWRCKVNRSDWIIFWMESYNFSIYNIIPNRGNI